MIVLDASVVLGLVNADDAMHERAVEMMTRTVGERLGMSPITMAEVSVGPARQGRLPTATALLSSLEIESLPLPDDAAIRLATIRAATNLRLPDCCVILAAEQAQASLATFDERLQRAATQRDLEVVG